MKISFPTGSVGAVVLDIEGTTTPIAFVYEVLFPLARRNLRAYLREHGDAPETREAMALLRVEWTEDSRQGDRPPPWEDDIEGIAAYVEWLMDRDRKSRGLKLLQGQIWEQGYADGSIRSEVFPDVAPAVREWRAAGKLVAIYSSGSVFAQKLLFAHTTAGDLTPLFDHLFDTTVGPKTDPESYRTIARHLGLTPPRVLFVSDVVKELDAAKVAGCHVVLCKRPGNPVQPARPDLVAIERFDDVVLDAPVRP